MIVRNAFVYTADQVFEKREIYIREGKFAERAEREEGEEVLDAEGCFAIPGLLDIHFHGAMGYDICDASWEAYERIAEYEAANGITAICPATMTLPVPELENVLKLGAEFSKSGQRGADLVGFNMEGPFISHARKGAQNEKYIIPCSSETVDRFIRASEGLLRIIGLAPDENPDFESFIRENRGKLILSLAHTDANYEEARRAFLAGASHVVHLYNAMRGLHHRDPGLVGAAADSPGVNAELICDGIHVHPAAVRAAFRLLGKERILLISDSLRTAGMPDGEYPFTGQTVVKKGSRCTLKESGNLAGSVSNLMDCLRCAVLQMGIPLEDAVACASIQPARAIHVEDRYGSIEDGKRGNLVLLRRDGKLSLEKVIKDGEVLG